MEVSILKPVVLVLFVCASILHSTIASPEPVAVRFMEGLVHGFLSLRAPDGTVLASGDLTQLARGDRVTSRLVFRFKDGSSHDETAVFSQRGHFRLLTNRLIQKGPAFSRPLDMTIDTQTRQVTVRYMDDGKEKTEADQYDLPPDLANGMIITLLKNVRPGALPKSLSLVAATPKPRIVKLEIAVAGKEPFTVAASGRRATHYVLKVEIGGIAGVIAPLLGKQPPDSHVWILEGEAPAFLRSQAPLFMDGPLWRIDLVSPVWPRTQ